MYRILNCCQIFRPDAGESPLAKRFIDSTKRSTMSAPHSRSAYGNFKNVRLDLEAASGSTKMKRRFFEEQIAKNSVTDRLLQRKIQLGMTAYNGAPSESTAGYDSVEADFAGGASNTASSRTSPSLVAAGELDDVTITEDRREVSRIPVRQSTMSSEDGPRSETVVPDRRSVADLRRQITSRLEMKAPDSSSRGPSRAEGRIREDG
ncbi:hypothetical protein GCK32_014776 [Trichostrongylus colubriformis]|uniref:Uncharacterized protein n=1 Tax=Trichostrongylus colubriformis TaxID=6319 RepID=A0AAN8FF98_TRICO